MVPARGFKGNFLSEISAVEEAMCRYRESTSSIINMYLLDYVDDLYMSATPANTKPLFECKNP